MKKLMIIFAILLLAVPAVAKVGLYGNPTPIVISSTRNDPVLIKLYDIDNTVYTEAEVEAITKIEIKYTPSSTADSESTDSVACADCFNTTDFSAWGEIWVDIANVAFTVGRDREAELIIYTADYTLGYPIATLDIKIDDGAIRDAATIDPVVTSIALNDLSDVSTSGATTGQFLQKTGAATYAFASASGAGLGDMLEANYDTEAEFEDNFFAVTTPAELDTWAEFLLLFGITGTPDGSKYLRDDGTWQTPAGGSGAVDSVNGETGTVVLDADDIDDTSTTNKWVTTALINAWNALVTFPGFGTDHSTAAYGDHDHSGVYEPAFDYGTGTGEIDAADIPINNEYERLSSTYVDGAVNELAGYAEIPSELQTQAYLFGTTFDINLTWNVPNDNRVTHVDIFRAEGPAYTFGTVPLDTVTFDDIPYNDNTGSVDTWYAYKLRSTDGSDDSAFGNVILVYVDSEIDENLIPDLSGTYATSAQGSTADTAVQPGDTVQTNSGTTLPATCTVGEMFLDTDADTNGSLYTCIATDTWKEVDDDGAAGGGGDLLADGTVPMTSDWDIGAYIITGLRFISDIATGTAPFTVASTTVVTNLNADLLDGESASAFQDADADLDTYAGITPSADGQALLASADANPFTDADESNLDNQSGTNTGDNPGYDSVDDIPHATPNEDDTTHFSNAGEIWAYIVSLGYSTFTWDFDGDDITNDSVDDDALDFGSGTDQINSDDIPEGSTNFYDDDGVDANTTYTDTDFDIKDLTDSTSLRSTWSAKLGPVGPVLNNGDTSAGYMDFLEDSDNGTNYLRLLGPPSCDTITVNLPATAGTLALTTGVTYENLSANSDIGTGSAQVAQGDHSHTDTISHERGGLEADVSAYSGIPKITGGTTGEIKYNFGTSVAPTVNDDIDGDWSIGSKWYDTTADAEYTCLDTTDGAAVWSAGGGGSTKYGYIVLAAPMGGGSGLNSTPVPDFTSEYYGQAQYAFGTDTDNYVIYRVPVREDMNTAEDILLLNFCVYMPVAGTTDNTQRYIISMDVVASDADYTGTFARPINIDLTETASTASGVLLGTNTNTTLTDWKTDLSSHEGEMWLIKILRDGNDGTYDTSTVNTYTAPITLRYTKDLK